MKVISWDARKNELLRQERDVTFEEVVIAIDDGNILDVIEHRNMQKFGHQLIFVIVINNYAYMVPFVETDNEIFLKTIIPSRKLTKIYLINK